MGEIGHIGGKGLYGDPLYIHAQFCRKSKTCIKDPWTKVMAGGGLNVRGGGG